MEQLKKVRKPNSWIEHVKKYALDNNISYRNSVKLARDSYKMDSVEKPQRKTTPVKIFKVVEVIEEIEEKPKRVKKPKPKLAQLIQVPTAVGPILEFIDESVIGKKVKAKKLKTLIE